jgi:hypothetical protein
MHRIPRPDGIYLSKIPNIELGKCELYNVNSREKPLVDVLCVSWAKYLYIYKFVQSNLNY